MSTDIHADRVLILDFGSQYTQLIARRVREAGVYSEIHPWDMPEDAIRDFAPRAIILSGGPETVTAEEAPRAPDVVFELGVPVLGICYGMQTMAAQLGGKVEMAEHHEYGYAQVRARGHTALLRDIEDHTSPEGYGLLDVWMSHGDRVVVFVDNGLLRYQEGDQVMTTFAKHMGVKVIRVDAENRFLRALKGVTDPEQKRKIIGNLFIEVFEEEAEKLTDVKWLAQGTIYPDVIESAGARTGKAGRGAQARRGTGSALRHGLPPSLPGSGARGSHPGRGKEGIRRHPAPG